ncbi:MAG: hypothetical protein JJE09_02205 [Bacteroidia bacterium]|nr:hypothetical protein [Bacteroidia bacterium]
MKTKYLSLVLLLAFAGHNVHSQSRPKSIFKKSHYQEIDFEDLMHRYLGKEAGSFNRIEGIYSVSCVITQTSKSFWSGRQKVKVVERQDNYARVALLKDWPGAKRDFIEVSLSYRAADRYPVVGEVSTLAEGEAYIYKHIEPDGTVYDFSMAVSPDMLEGQHAEMLGRKTITYKLSYMKIYPKSRIEEIASNQIKE